MSGDRRQSYELRVRQCLEAARAVMVEARREGFEIEAHLYESAEGEPRADVEVMTR